MRVSLNCVDDVIHINGKPMVVDCSALRDEGISAIQWYGKHGEIEFLGHPKPNEMIKDFTPYQDFVDMAEPWPEPKLLTLEEHRKLHDEWLEKHPEYKAQLEAEQARIQALVDQAQKEHLERLEQIQAEEAERMYQLLNSKKGTE